MRGVASSILRLSPPVDRYASRHAVTLSRYEPVLVRKRPGMESVDLLEPESPHPSSTGNKPASAGGGGGSSSKGDGSADQAPSAMESVWSSVTGMMGFGGRDDGGSEGEGGRVVLAGEGEGQALARQKNEEEGERVHVFSLATGHLYERFLKVGVSGRRVGSGEGPLPLRPTRGRPHLDQKV